MELLITPHALMSPINNSGLDIDKFMIHYRLLGYMSNHKDIFYPYVYDETIDILTQSNLFPTYSAFNSYIFSNGLDEFISANDLVLLFNNFLQQCDTINDRTDVFSVEVDNTSLDLISTTPICNFKTNNMLSLCDYLNSSKGLNVIPILDSNITKNKFDMAIKLMHIYSGDNVTSISNYIPSLDLYSCCSEILSCYEAENMWDKATTSEGIRLAIYTKCIQLIESGAITFVGTFDIDSFSIGEHFIESLRANQCINGGVFSRVTLDVIARLLLGTPKSDLDVFFKYGDRSKPRMRGNDVAYRTHLTKSGVALRLMVWKLPCGTYELANVGPKHELIIR